jgi:hypothetical protein
MKPIAVLLKTHFFDDALKRQVEALRAAVERLPVELVLSVDAKATKLPPAEAVPGVALHGFDSADYAGHGLRPHPQQIATGVPVDWFHSDYSLLDYHLKHPGRHDVLWQVEYDVTLRSGTWDFLARDLPFDFLAPSLKVRERHFEGLVQGPCLVQPGWHWWPALLGYPAAVGCFFPCVRATARALDCLIAAYRRGVTGYCEVSAPSVLAGQIGLRVGPLSEIPRGEAELHHPHWDRGRRSEPNSGFVLNQPALSVDS